MRNDAGETTHTSATASPSSPRAPVEEAQASVQPRPSWPMRWWAAAPDWVFRAIGVMLVFAYLLPELRVYLTDFPRVGPYMPSVVAVDGHGHPIYGPRIYFPLAKILRDLTFVLVGLAFCLRLPARQRACRASEIVIPLIAAVWPLSPFLLKDLLEVLGADAGKTLTNMLGFGQIGYARFYLGVLMLCVGNSLDLWGYGTLFRSVSIVAEARDLKVTGPYRVVRHPIYLGQFVAQGAVWLVLVRLQLVWVVFYALFVAMQLYRSRVEDRVLERTFGEPYLVWKRKTFWFVGGKRGHY